MNADKKVLRGYILRALYRGRVNPFGLNEAAIIRVLHDARLPNDPDEVRVELRYLEDAAKGYVVEVPEDDMPRDPIGGAYWKITAKGVDLFEAEADARRAQEPGVAL